MSITLNCLLIVFTHFEMSSKNLPSSTLLKYLPLGDNLASLRRNDSQATIVIRCQRILFISTVVYRKGYCFNGEELVSLLIGDAIHDKQIHVLLDALYYSINTLYAELFCKPSNKNPWFCLLSLLYTFETEKNRNN